MLHHKQLCKTIDELLCTVWMVITIPSHDDEWALDHLLCFLKSKELFISQKHEHHVKHFLALPESNRIERSRLQFRVSTYTHWFHDGTIFRSYALHKWHGTFNISLFQELFSAWNYGFDVHNCLRKTLDPPQPHQESKVLTVQVQQGLANFCHCIRKVRGHYSVCFARSPTSTRWVLTQHNLCSISKPAMTHLQKLDRKLGLPWFASGLSEVHVCGFLSTEYVSPPVCVHNTKCDI